MRYSLRHFIFALLTLATAGHLSAQAITHLFTGGSDSYWGNGLNWYAYNPATGLQTNGSVPPPDGTIVVAAVNANFVSGTEEAPNVYAYTGSFEAINSRLNTTLAEWGNHNTTLALRGTSVVRGLTISGGLEVRNEGALTIDYDGNGNGNLGSYDMFRMRNTAGATVDIVTNENSARVISMGYYSGYFANEGVTRINTLAGSSVLFDNGNYGGVLSNSGSLEKSGVGNLIADNYSQASTGGTFVEAGEFRIHSGSLDGILDVSDGATFHISGDATFRDGLEGRGAGAYLVDSGTIKPEGDTTFNRLILAGSTIHNDDAVATLTVGDLVMSSGAVGSYYTLASVVATGTGSAVTGDIRFEGNYDTQLPALTNEGTLAWSAGNISAFNRMYATNASSGTFIADAGDATSRTMSGGYYGGWFQNDGIMQKTGAGTIAINAYYRDSGTTQVDAGVLSFGGGGSSSGTFVIAADATARLTGGTLTLQDGFSATGAGIFGVQGGILAPVGSTSISNLTVNGGQVYDEGTAGTLTVGNIALSSGAVGSYNTLTETIATGSESTITGDIRIEGNSNTQLAALTNAGTLTWSGGNIGAFNRMYMANSATGTFIADAADTTTRTINGGYYGGWFQNDGAVQKTGEGTIAINAYYRGSGTTQVDAGVLSFGAGGSTSGSFNIAADATARLTGGTLTLQDGFAATGGGTFEVKGGILAPVGSTSISNLTVNGGQVYDEGTAGTLTVGNIALSSGAVGSYNTLTETVATGSGSTITGDVRIEGNSNTQLPALTNAGTLTWSGGNISAFNRMYMTNSATGTFIADAADATTRTLGVGNYGGWFQNDGTVQKTGTGNISINAYYRGSGDTQVDAGMLSFGGGGSVSGNFAIADDATARLTGGTLTLQDGFASTGAGAFEVQGGILAPVGSTSISNLTVNGGQVYNEDAVGTLTVGNLSLSSGAIGSSSTLANTIATGSGSTITGEIRIEGNGTTQLPALTNAGTLTWSDGNIGAFNHMYLTNADTGNFIMDAAAGTTRTINGGYYGGWLQNDGTVQKTGEGTIAINAYYLGSGTATVDAGVLQLGSGGNMGGNVTISANATFRHSGGGLILQDGFTATGAGRFENTGGDLQIGGDVSIAQLHVSSGQVGFNETTTATLHVGDLHLSGGTIGSNNNQATVIASGANSTITGNVTLNGTGLNEANTLSNTGTITWTAGNVNGGNFLKLHNAGTGTLVADIGSGSTVTLSGGYYGGWFINDGTVRKTGEGTVNFNSTVQNNGVLSVEGGRLVINGSLTSGSGASLHLANNASFRAGSAITLAALSGSGTIENSVTVTSSLTPGSSPGLLTIQGNLTVGSGATSVFELAGLTAGIGYDQVISTGSVALDGMLALSITPSFAATLSSSATFDLLSGTSVTGSFINAEDGSRLTDIAGLGSFLVSYTGSTFRLGDWQANASAVPEPATAVALFGFTVLGLALTRRRRRDLSLGACKKFQGND